MKKNIVLLIVIFMISCKQTTSNNDEIKVSKEFSESILKIELTQSDDLSKDKFLYAQMDEYMRSILNGNLDIVADYSYPDIQVWIDEKYPNMVNNREDFKKVFLEPMKKINELTKDKETKVEYEVGDITKRLHSVEGDTMVYLIVSSIIIKHKFEEIKNGDENVAVSFDGGKKWKLMIKDEEMTREILRYKFSDESINKLLN